MRLPHVTFGPVKCPWNRVVKYAALLAFVSGCAAQSRNAPAASAGVKQVIAGLQSPEPRALYELLPPKIRKRTSYNDFAARWKATRVERHRQAKAMSEALGHPHTLKEWAAVRHGKLGTIALHRTGRKWQLESEFASHSVALRPAAAVKYFATALARRDLVALLRVLTRPRRTALSTRIEKLSNSLSQRIRDGDLTIGSLGDKRAEVHWQDDDHRYRILLQKEGDQWRVEDVDLRPKPAAR